jgi:glycosyltransferase involved in cell wall biosynthesis
MRGMVSGGVVNYVHRVSAALVQRGHQVTVFVYSDRSAEWIDEGVKVIEVEIPPLWSVSVPRRFQTSASVLLKFLQNWRASRRVAKAVWREHALHPFDIVQASNVDIPGYALVGNGKIPLVCRMSDYPPMIRKALRGENRALAQKLVDRLNRHQSTGADAVFAPSQLIVQFYAQYEGIEVALLRTPVSLRPIEPDGSVYESALLGKPFLLFAGKLSRLKGIDLMTDVLPCLHEKYPDLHFAFAGREEKMINGRTVTQAIRASCQSFEAQIHYFSVLPKSQLYPLMSHALAVLMPSRVDNYPNVCIEAQAMGTPVIGTYDSSLDEMIVPGVTGFLARNGDPADFYRAVIDLLKLSDQEIAVMRENNLKHSDQILREDRVGQLIDYYQETISKFNHRQSAR